MLLIRCTEKTNKIIHEQPFLSQRGKGDAVDVVSSTQRDKASLVMKINKKATMVATINRGTIGSKEINLPSNHQEGMTK